MASPFFDNAANVVTAAPGVGSFVLGAAAPGARSILTTTLADAVFSYAAIEGSSWEIGIGVYTHATGTLDRNVKLSSNANALVAFGAGAIVSLIVSADVVQPHVGVYGWGAWLSIPAATMTSIGLPAPTFDGTPVAGALSAATMRQTKKRTQITSLATASALAGVRGAAATSGVMVSTTARLGGFEFAARFGIGSALPASPRAFIGLHSAAGIGVSEPSATANWAGFYRDSAGGNLFLACRGAAGTVESFNTGIALAQNGWYSARIAASPGSNKISAALLRLDVPQAFSKSGLGATNPPVANTFMAPALQVGLSAASTAFVLDVGNLYLRSEMW